MLSHLKESTVFTWNVIVVFFKFFWFSIIATSGWMKGFQFVNKWYYSFLLPKILIVVVGYFVTPFPIWVLVPLSFLPTGIIGPIFFVAFILMFAH